MSVKSAAIEQEMTPQELADLLGTEMNTEVGLIQGIIPVVMAWDPYSDIEADVFFRRKGITWRIQMPDQDAIFGEGLSNLLNLLAL